MNRTYEKTVTPDLIDEKAWR